MGRWVIIILAVVVLCGCMPGDANGDRCVNILDFSIVAGAYGSHWGCPGYDVRADFNLDGVVDEADMEILSAHYGDCER